MRRTALISLTVLHCSHVLAQTEVCQTIADAYATDNELKTYAIPLREPTEIEAASWPDMNPRSPCNTVARSLVKQ